MAHGIAKQFGTSCEVVIHDLNKNLETSIVHIENGQVTNRKSGDGPSGIVLETLHKKLRPRLEPQSVLSCPPRIGFPSVSAR